MRKTNKKRVEIHEELHLGARLKGVRIRSGLRQDEVAKRIGVAPAQISTWEKGETEPGIYAVIVLSKVYGLELDKLVGLKELTRDDEFNLYMRF